MEKPPDMIRAVSSAANQAQQQLLLSELKRVGTQQEQLKKAVSEAIAFSDAKGETLEVAHLKSFPKTMYTESKQAEPKPAQQQEQQTQVADSQADHAQMQLLFAELKRIEGQQQMLKSAVAQNKMLVVLPPTDFNAESVEDEYAEEVVVKPDPDRFVPSGGLTGFEVARDLMKLDFSTPEEAPEEFRAVMFNMPPAKKGMRMPSLTALEIQTQGSFGLLAEPGLKFFLKRLQEDQEDMLELIKQREKARGSGLGEPRLPTLKVPAPAVDWDLPNTPPQRMQPAAVEAFVQVAANIPAQAEAAEQESIAPAAVNASGQSIKPVVKKSREPAQSRFGAAAAAASAANQGTDAQVDIASSRSTQAGVADTASIAQPSAGSANQFVGGAIKASRGVSDLSPATPADAAKMKKDADAEAAAKKKKELELQAEGRKKQDLVDSRRQAAKVSAGSHLVDGAADRAAALNAKTGTEGEDEEEDVQLSAEEMGFPAEAGDAFAALKAKMEVAQGKKKGGKKEEKKKAKGNAAVNQAGSRMQTVNVADERIMAHQQTAMGDTVETVPTADVQVAHHKIDNTDSQAQAAAEPEQSKEQAKAAAKAAAKESKRLQEQKAAEEKQRKKDLKQQQKEEEKRLKKELKHREEEEKKAEKQQRKEAKQQASGKDAASSDSDASQEDKSHAAPAGGAAAAAVVAASDTTER